MRSIRSLSQTATDFFQNYPAWKYALALYVGSLVSSPFFYLSIFLALFKKGRTFVLFFCLALCVKNLSQKELPINKTPQIYQGIFTPKQCKIYPSFFGENRSVEGIFEINNKSYYLKVLDKENKLQEPHVYDLKLSALQGERHPKITLLNIEKRPEYSFVYHLRQVFRDHLQKLLFNPDYPKASLLLLGLFTGSLEDKLLLVQFQNYGLAHLLALSGFHLNLVASLFLTLFPKALLGRLSIIIGAFVLSFYVFLVGATPSLVRAFIMILFQWIAPYCVLKNEPLNTLGVALGATTLLCIDQTLHPGFVLSFSATLALILFHPAWNRCLSFIGKPENFYEKFLYLILKVIFLQGFIFCMTLPFVLFYFSKVSLDSLYFNLFYPTLIALFMTLAASVLTAGLFLPWITPIGLQYLYPLINPVLAGISRPSSSFILSCSLSLTSFLLLLIPFFVTALHFSKKHR